MGIPKIRGRLKQRSLHHPCIERMNDVTNITILQHNASYESVCLHPHLASWRAFPVLGRCESFICEPWLIHVFEIIHSCVTRPVSWRAFPALGECGSAGTLLALLLLRSQSRHGHGSCKWVMSHCGRVMWQELQMPCHTVWKMWLRKYFSRSLLLLCNTLQHYNTQQHTATHSNTQHHTASHRNMLQHAALLDDYSLFFCMVPVATQDTTHSHVCRNSFTRVTWLIYKCDMTHLCSAVQDVAQQVRFSRFFCSVRGMTHSPIHESCNSFTWEPGGDDTPSCEFPYICIHIHICM